MYTKHMRNHRALIILALIFLFTRFFNLTIVPIFNDEAVHIDWGYKELHGRGLFYSLNDAKQPLLMWLFGLSQLVMHDPLFASRTVSVLFGLASLIGIYKLAEHISTKKVALYAAVTYLCTPLFLFFDKQALMEGPLVAVSVWSILIYLKIWERPTIKRALALGAILGIGFFIKTTALFFLVALVIVSVYEILIRKRPQKGPVTASLILAAAVSQGVLAPLYFQPLFWQTLSRTAERSLGIREVLSFPFAQWWQTVRAVIEISWWQLTPPLFILSVLGIGVVIHKSRTNTKHIPSVWMYFALILIFYFLTARSNPVRYVVPLLAGVPLLVGMAVEFLSRWKFLYGTALLSLAVPLYCIFTLTMNPVQYFSQLAHYTTYSQQDEYVTQWPAGFGVLEVLQEIYTRTGVQSAVVAVRPDAGIPESAVFAYLNADTQLQPLFFDATIAPFITQYDCIQATKPFYFVSRDTQLGGLEQYVQELGRIQKPQNKSSLGLYTLKQCTTTQKVLTLEFE